MTDSWYGRIVEGIAKRRGFSVDVPARELSQEHLDYLLYTPRGEKVRIGYRSESHTNFYDATFEGLIPNLERRYRETESEWVKTELEKFMSASAASPSPSACSVLGR